VEESSEAMGNERRRGDFIHVNDLTNGNKGTETGAHNSRGTRTQKWVRTKYLKMAGEYPRTAQCLIVNLWMRERRRGQRSMKKKTGPCDCSHASCSKILRNPDRVTGDNTLWKECEVDRAKISIPRGKKILGFSKKEELGLPE